MGRVKHVAPLVSTVSPRVAYLGDHDARNARHPLRRLYFTARWARLRQEVLRQAMYTCARCGWASADTSRFDVDHIEPHNEDPERFWARENLQCLCHTCHGSAKQREDIAAARQRGGGSDFK